MDILTLAQQGAGAAALIPLLVVFAIYIGVIILVIAGWWTTFTKAGQPGWGAIIPIYNTYLLCKIGGRPGWWVILLLIPYLNFIFYIIVMIDIAKAFGRGIGFGVGLILLNPIFMCILGFGSSEYQGPA
ncbi:MAG: DUF5684 domain-containing protein [Planctomycetota bacterium]